MAETTDPIEDIVRSGLDAAGINYVDENDPRSKGLDFYLPDYLTHIECKQFHTERTAEQMSRSDNVIVIQGRKAAEFFALRVIDFEEQS